jgi:hypothetical protein
MSVIAKLGRKTDQPVPAEGTMKGRNDVDLQSVTDVMPEEFAGMTEFDCCGRCVLDRDKAAAAQKRLNEIDAAYPRRDSRNPRSSTVLESDAEWLARNPHIAEEFKKLCAERNGVCYISGEAICAHPMKCGLHAARMNDGEALGRYARAKTALAHRKIDLRGDKQ